MDKQIEILGIGLDNYTVRESLLKLDAYLNNNVLNIIKTVSMEQLLLSVDHPFVSKGITEADLTVIKERELLGVSGQFSTQRMREIQDNDFLTGLINRAVKNRKKIYLLADSIEELDQMAIYFAQQNAKFKVEGAQTMGVSTKDVDAIINEINGCNPDMIFSALSSPFEEEFLVVHKNKLTATVWLSLGAYYDRVYRGLHLADFMKRTVLRVKLKKAISKYKMQGK